jgi:hypothetical protein
MKSFVSATLVADSVFIYISCNSANKLVSDVTFVNYLNRSYDPVMVVVKIGINEI